MSDAVDFLHADKHESLQCLYNISKNLLEMKLTFWMQIKIKVSYKLISTLFGHQSLLQGDTIIIDGHDQALSKYSK